MARITAKFNGKCSACNGTLPKGSEIEYQNKRAYCLSPACAPNSEEEHPASGDAERIADECGYIAHERALQSVWSTLRILPVRDRVNGERESGTAPGEQSSLWSMPASDRSDN